MTDMRATERLLQAIDEHVTNLEEWFASMSSNDPHRKDVWAIKEAVDELLTRGDTLVRAYDLRQVMELVERNGGIHAGQFSEDQARTTAVNRLQIALGGRL